VRKRLRGFIIRVHSRIKPGVVGRVAPRTPLRLEAGLATFADLPPIRPAATFPRAAGEGKYIMVGPVTQGRRSSPERLGPPSLGWYRSGLQPEAWGWPNIYLLSVTICAIRVVDSPSARTLAALKPLDHLTT